MMGSAQTVQTPEVAWWLPDFIPRYFEVPNLPQVDPSSILRLEPAFGIYPTTNAMRDAIRQDSLKYANGSRSFDVKSRSITAGVVSLVDRLGAAKPFIRPNFAFLLENGGLFPFHATPFTAYCANVFLEPLHPSSSTSTSPGDASPGSTHLSGLTTYDIRVMRLRFKNTAALTCFCQWIYRQDDRILELVLMPRHPLSETMSLETLKRDPQSRYDLANALSSTYTELQMWNFVYMILDFRDLMTTLGVDDVRVWAAMEVAWDVMLQALNESCVREAQRDAARGVDTSQAKEWLNRALGIFDTGEVWQNMEGSRVETAGTPPEGEGTTPVDPAVGSGP